MKCKSGYKKIMIFVMMFILVLTIAQVSAFMPKFSHKYITDKALETPLDSEFYKACAKYPDLCYSGVVLNDISVIFYYTSRGKYTATHNPPFCAELLSNVATIPGKDIDKMRACAVGGCMHQPED